MKLVILRNSGLKSKQTGLLTRLAILLIALCVAPLLHAQGRAECSLIKSEILKRPVRYCAFLPPGFDDDKTRRYPVLYFLHGLGDNEQSLLNFGDGTWFRSCAVRARSATS